MQGVAGFEMASAQEKTRRILQRLMKFGRLDKLAQLGQECQQRTKIKGDGNGKSSNDKRGKMNPQGRLQQEKRHDN